MMQRVVVFCIYGVARVDSMKLISMFVDFLKKRSPYCMIDRKCLAIGILLISEVAHHGFVGDCRWK
jgi:hypothetical protein